MPFLENSGQKPRAIKGKGTLQMSAAEIQLCHGQERLRVAAAQVAGEAGAAAAAAEAAEPPPPLASAPPPARRCLLAVWCAWGQNWSQPAVLCI